MHLVPRNIQTEHRIHNRCCCSAPKRSNVSFEAVTVVPPPRAKPVCPYSTLKTCAEFRSVQVRRAELDVVLSTFKLIGCCTRRWIILERNIIEADISFVTCATGGYKRIWTASVKPVRSTLALFHALAPEVCCSPLIEYRLLPSFPPLSLISTSRVPVFTPYIW